MGPPHRGGTFSPSPAQSLVTASNHSPHGSFSAGPSPSTNSPTSSGTVNRITVAQVYVLLSSIKEGNHQQAEQLRKLIEDQEGMEVYQKYFGRLVVNNAPQIFPGVSRSAVGKSGSYQILVDEMRKISRDPEQAGKIADAIETANDDIFQDFDLSTFMDHFKLDALEKVILALAFKTGTRPNLKAKADAILSTNYAGFLNILSASSASDHGDLSPEFVSTILDRYLQGPPPTFDDNARNNLFYAVESRYSEGELTRAGLVGPVEVLSTLSLLSLISDQYPLTMNIYHVGASYTSDEETCINHLRKVSTLSLSEEQVSNALLYAAISRTHVYSVEVLVAALRKVVKEVPHDFSWQQVVKCWDRPDLRITPSQFLAIFKALLPMAREESNFDIQQLWGGSMWNHPETQLSFLRAFGLQNPDQFDGIPGFQPSFTMEDFVGCQPDIIERAAAAVRHPLASKTALTAIFNTALATDQSLNSSEAKRFFNDVVLPNLDIFIVSAFFAFGTPKPWQGVAVDTVRSIFLRFFYRDDQNWKFVLYSLWRRDKAWVIQALMQYHVQKPLALQQILEQVLHIGWLEELVKVITGFGLDLTALAHAKNRLNLDQWARSHVQHSAELRHALLTFLGIKAEHEIRHQRQPMLELQSVMLPVRTVHALLNILNDISPKPPSKDLVVVQRLCITAYPRLINYGQGCDAIIDANGEKSNSLPQSAITIMEEHYKKMYSDEIEVRDVIASLTRYKQSMDSSDQDVFDCMIHGLFEEYALYYSYPLEALATTAVLFGAIISHKLISDLPLETGLGMILEAVNYSPDQSMYKFGLQALMQLFGRFREWPGFCKALLQIPGLEGTDAWRKAEEIARDLDADLERNGNGNGTTNGTMELTLHPAESTHPPFASINVEPSKYADSYEEPSGETQEKVVFVLNNTTESNLDTKFMELKEVMKEEYHGWFAGHIVEERAKMQPNYLQLYLDLLRQFDSKRLNYEVLRNTYSSVIRLLNAESTLQSSIERGHLKNLAGWLGSLTVAQDKPILHRNVAFKQLLIEAYDTQRLIVVIPFVCKVLVQGASSVVFKPPNPWLMDIVHLLIELYHSAELKLNLKFEIEVLCKGLSLDHKSIEPSTDIQTRILPVDEPMEPISMDVIDDRFNALSIGGATSNGRFSPHDIVSTVPDLGPLLTFPPPNDIVNQQGLREIVSAAITRAVHEIIAPVVERSVTIAAISTAQMIRKDFATEPDESKVQAAAISMVKRTAGSLALVTSKEPLRASMNNYIRQMQAQLNQGLPEGTIIMCVNSNLDMACAQVEKKAEEKAVPEIEEMIEPELEYRRQHKINRPNEPYYDASLSRWGMTIPTPYKLEPSLRGLNPEQMAIYEEFARPPRMNVAVPGPTITEANKPMPIDPFDGQFTSVSNLPTPGESILVSQQQHYTQRPAGQTNGRSNGQHADPRTIVDYIQKWLNELFRLSAEAPEQKYDDLPHSHPIKDTIDRIIGFVISSGRETSTSSAYTAESVCQALFSYRDPGDELSNLSIESSVHLLSLLCKVQPNTTGRWVAQFILRQPDERILNVALVLALLRTDFGLLDWQRIDLAVSKAILSDKDGAIEFLSSLMDRVLFNDSPVALRTDFVRSLDALGQKVAEVPDHEAGRELMQKLEDSGLSASLTHPNDAKSLARQDQMEYIFEEWVRLCHNPHSPKGASAAMVAQIHKRHVIGGPEDSVFFFRLCIDVSVDRFEQVMNGQGNVQEAYLWVDGLGKLIARLVVFQEDNDYGMVKSSKSAYLKATLAVIVLVLNHHHVMHGENFNQKVFYRLFSTIMNELDRLTDSPPKGLGSISPESRAENILVFPQIFLTIQPLYFPGFIGGWLSLISHRSFLPQLLSLPDKAGWNPLLQLLECYFQLIGELLNPLRISHVARQLYQATLKLLVVLHHDFPDFLVENHLSLTAAIPTHCVQLQNMVLATKPNCVHNMPNPLDNVLKIDQLEEIREDPIIRADPELTLREANLFDLLIRALKSGPGEPLLAAIAHSIQQPNGRRTSVGFPPVNVDTALINAIVIFVGQYSIRRASREEGPTFISGSPDAALLNMLSKELKPEARYYFIIAIVNQLRFPSTHTYYFSLALLDLFGTDQNDHEEAEVREQITRVLIERLSAKDNSQPWGLIVTLLELLKNPKYNEVRGQLGDFYPLGAH